MTRLAAILACLGLAGCNAAPAKESQAVELGADVTLVPGATASLKTGQMSVRFVAVTEDSRCPRDTTCVWAGEVKVQLEIQVSQIASQVEILEGGGTVAGAYRITLVRVDPPRANAARIALQEYRATLKIDKG